MKLNYHEQAILNRISELRVELASYQTTTKQPRIDTFAAAYLDPLIFDITDLKMGQPIPE